MRIRKFVTFIPCFALAVTLALPLARRSLTTAQSNAWLPVSSPTTEQLYGVYCTTADDCWAVGSGGTIIHYDGTTWTAVESSINFHLRSVSCPADDDCWAVGEDGKVAHYDGSVWSISAVLPSTDDLLSVFCNTVDDCWTVGVWNRIFHYGGASWTSVYSPGSGWSRLTSVSCAAVNDCWAVSDLGYVSHYDGTYWSASRPTTNQLEGLFCLAIDDCWAVGYRCVLRHYDGDQWTTVSSPNSDHLYSVFCAASDDCWAVGDGSIIHYDGLAWSNVLGGVSLQSVFCSAADDCWAVGGDGAIRHYTTARQVFLPLIFKRYPPIPEIPALYPIENNDGDGDYTVQWLHQELADQYELQQSVNSGGWTTVYTGPDESRDFADMPPATYSYRVRAENVWGQSGWSNVESVVVLPPDQLPTPAPGPRPGRWEGHDDFEGSFRVTSDRSHITNFEGSFWTPMCGHIQVPEDLTPPAELTISDNHFHVTMNIPDTITFLRIDGTFNTETSVEGDYSWGVEGCGFGGRISWSASWQGN